MAYFNTTSITDPTLSEYRAINSKQDLTILKCFRKNPTRKMTPFNVQSYCELPSSVPITSIRRSINTLTKAGLLVKLDEKKPGGFGRANSLWMLKNDAV